MGRLSKYAAEPVDGIEIMEESNRSRITVRTGASEEDGSNNSNQVTNALENANESLRRQRKYLAVLVVALLSIIIGLAVKLSQMNEQLGRAAIKASLSSDITACANGAGGETSTKTIEPGSGSTTDVIAGVVDDGGDSAGSTVTVDAGNNGTDIGLLCGCKDCEQTIWNTPAGYPAFSCGSRITYLHETFPKRFPSQIDACRQVVFEFPCECGKCDPSRCNIAEKEFVLPQGWEPPAMVEAQAVTTYNRGTELYCYPPEGQRTSFTMWNGKYLEAKKDPNGGACGPGNNFFDETTIEVNGDDLTLKFTQGKASEVRVLLPPEQMPYSYGDYDFHVKSVAVKDSTGVVKSSVLPKELVLGIFTWHAFEDYAQHENWNHEIDIEISRWNCEENADAQFLVQPPGYPQTYRFFSGEDATYDQSGHHWNFTWAPGSVGWGTSAGGGQTFTYTTEEALYKGTPDYVQCMPDNDVEVRLNLWNVLGARQPEGYEYDDVVEVVISNFTFAPSSVLALAVGDICSKDCQCDTGSVCEDYRCTTSS